MRHFPASAGGRSLESRIVNTGRDIVVIGGGAAGFFGAIACAEADPGCRVQILERNAAVLAKVRISGGGRCNVTHACFDPSQLTGFYPRGGLALRGPFSRFQPRDTVAWFEARGVRLKTERDGRIFPASDNSASIVDCLTRAARNAGVLVRTHTLIDGVTRREEGFAVALRDGAPLHADRVLLATGSAGRGWEWASALGHTVVPAAPSLFTFEVTDPRIDGLAGLSVAHARVDLPDARAALGARGAGLTQSGPLLITHWGLSGPAVLRLSAWAARVLHDSGYRATLSICWLPEWREDALIDRLQALKRERGGQLVSLHAPFAELPSRLWQRLCAAAGIFDEQRWAKLPKSDLLKLAGELLHGQFQITGKGVFKEEFVTAGGVDLDEVNFKTMESRKCPGLHFAGEVLDIDGVTGGFNFQCAWTTGWLAGKGMADSR